MIYNLFKLLFIFITVTLFQISCTTTTTSIVTNNDKNIIIKEIFDISQLNDDDFVLKVNEDRVTLRIISSRLDSFKVYSKDFFKNLQISENKTISFNQRQKAKEIWGFFSNQIKILTDLTHDYQYYFKLAVEDENDKLYNAFINEYYSFILFYSSGMDFINNTQHIEHFETIFDEENKEYGIIKGEYRNLKWNILHLSDISKVLEGYKSIEYIKENYNSEENLSSIYNIISEKYKLCFNMIKEEPIKQLVTNGLDILKDNYFSMIFPLQKKTAEFLGNTRVGNRKYGYITNIQCDSLIKKSKTGDIIFERSEWYLSNIGLPGFWPHVVLYIGNLSELEKWSLDNSEIFTYYRTNIDKNFISFTKYLEKKYPVAFKEYSSPENNFRIIEAIGEGVLFSSVKGSIGKSDYSASISPRNLSKLDIALAIEIAFSNYMKPYDFGFDFLSDNSLVCSELVYKSYETNSRINKTGIQFDLERIVGILTLPPNSMVDDFFNNKTLSKNLKFNWFYDCDIENERSFLSNETEFKKSYTRPRWGYKKRASKSTNL